MKQFTDLLEEWIYAREILNEAKENYDGYSFSYFHSQDIQREENARNALNTAFEKEVDTAIALEREACAKVCESRITPGTGSVAILNGAAGAIRARGDNK